MPTRRNASALLVERLRCEAVVEREDLAALRDVRLVERALAGDVDAIRQWLWRFGGDQWREAIAASGEGG